MNKNVYSENIKEVDLLEGKYVEGKGTEIWENIDCFFEYNNLDHLNKTLLALALDKMKDMFVYSIRHIEDDVEKYWHCEEYADIARSKNYFPVEKVKKMMDEDKVISIVIAKEPKLLGYIDFNKYGTSLGGQIEFVEDLCALKGYVLERDFYNITDIRNERELTLVHGYHMIPKGLETYFDGRSTDFHALVLDEFWDSFDGKMFDDWDPDDDVTVYHYKGKDWYIVPSAEEEEIEVWFEDKDGVEDSEIITGYCYRDDKKIKETINEMLEELERIKKELLLRSKFYFDSGIDEEY